MLGFGALGQFPLGGGLPGGAVSVTTIGWFVPLAEPVRFRRTPSADLAVSNQTLAFNPQPFVSFGSFELFADPVRALPRSPAALAPFQFWQPAPSPFVATGWFEWLSEPVRFRSELKPSLQTFLVYQANPITVIPFAWFEWLSEPVRSKPGLRHELQHVLGLQPAPSPFVATGWFSWLSDPVREKSGLRAALQQFLGHPAQLRPNPASSGMLNALETKDVFLGGAQSWNRAASAEIGILDTSYLAAEIGLVQQGASGTIASVAISISVI